MESTKETERGGKESERGREREGGKEREGSRERKETERVRRTNTAPTGEEKKELDS